jgi:hypothetical protein
LRLANVALALALFAPRLAKSQTPADWARADSATVRLPPAAFPQLPTVVRRDLERRRCRVPQSSDGRGAHNVVRGTFLARGAVDWAVLCSRAGASTILIYHAGHVTDSLGRADDHGYLQAAVRAGAPFGIGFSRQIGVASPHDIRAYAKTFGGPSLPHPLDHAGIEDSFVGKASTILYFARGRWRSLQGMD